MNQPHPVVGAPSTKKSKKSKTKQVKWSEARSSSSLKRIPPRSYGADDRFDDEFDPQQAPAPPSTPASEAWKVNNFYFAQLEEIERFGLTTLFVDFENLQDFSVEGEVGVLATAVATQYYRYFTKNG
jgi:hypothetical protein